MLTLALVTLSMAQDDCGLNEVKLPELSLVDVNTHSPTYDQLVSLSDHAGEVVVVYFAYAP